ncbi:putative MFS-type transporter [Alteripontixanthobacter maritimus]|uniref:Putative MFS-type transporter n=1 Tax=Alteripontixanthobacter maritimus TaxID=2161824 RepID=A0A369Q6K8_9SPHN|nr:MFS transporter [Alteripontixanthobacter maritimus]RDC58947.1 putative MFS-type transporter [Alteripontixanthobacter maritimus]
MQRLFLSIGSLLVSAAILLAGGGLHGTLISVRANIEGFSLAAIGVVMASYYAGFVVGCLKTPTLVARVGHIRVFTALAAITAACSLIFAIEPYSWLWIALRCVVGYCFAGLYMIVESWINERSTNANRGQVLAIYRAVDLAAMTVGQYLLLLADPGGFVLFSMVAILIALSIVPMALTRIESPALPAQVKLDPKKLWQLSPLAVAGCVAVGMSNGAFYAIAPVYVERMGYGTPTVALFMSVAILAGGAAQWPIGYLSDISDRRRILVLMALGATLCGLALTLFGGVSRIAMLAGAAGYGVFAMVLFGLSAAHANDHANDDADDADTPNDFVATSGGLLLVYGLGSIAGPLVAPLAMQSFGPAALWGYTTAVHGALFLFGVYRMTARRAVPAGQQEDYVYARPSTPTAFEFDPRSPEDEASPAQREDTSFSR